MQRWGRARGPGDVHHMWVAATPAQHTRHCWRGGGGTGAGSESVGCKRDKGRSLVWQLRAAGSMEGRLPALCFDLQFPRCLLHSRQWEGGSITGCGGVLYPGGQSEASPENNAVLFAQSSPSSSGSPASC